ncbi:hypothetical protein [Achromobacter deleyi]|uniref:hypothetical protein n=1 Tax=Achromobacter deleyi TaxID=1353891 RepID=UPI001C2E4445|nr:hypothetical protein [Achromobacter deleyi]
MSPLDSDGGGGGRRPNGAAGAENGALYPKLKEQLQQQNLRNIASQDPRLAAAIKGSGNANPNFSVGKGTRLEAEYLGKIWVGDGAHPLKGVPGGYISADGSRVYRPPTAKPNTPAQYNPTGVQANFQLRDPKTGASISNGHLIVK